jgi:hypothetical protein
MNVIMDCFSKRLDFSFKLFIMAGFCFEARIESLDVVSELLLGEG